MLWRRRPAPEVEHALARVKIFSTLRPRELRRLAVRCLLRNYIPGDFLIQEGSTGLGLFLITAGRVEVFKTLAGEKIPLAVLGQGDVLGEMSLLDDQPRSATAVALEPTQCLLLSRDQFRTLLERRPRIAWPIVPALALRIRDLQDQLLEAESRASSPKAAPPDAAVEDAVPAAQSAPSETSGGSSERFATTATRPAAESPAPQTAAAGSEAGLLRTQIALMMTGAIGLGESARLPEVFLRRLDEEAGLSRERSMAELARDLPSGLFAAGRSSWRAGLEVPSKMLESFRAHLRKPSSKD